MQERFSNAVVEVAQSLDEVLVIAKRLTPEELTDAMSWLLVKHMVETKKRIEAHIEALEAELVAKDKYIQRLEAVVEHAVDRCDGCYAPDGECDGFATHQGDDGFKHCDACAKSAPNELDLDEMHGATAIREWLEANSKL